MMVSVDLFLSFLYRIEMMNFVKVVETSESVVKDKYRRR